MFGPERLTNNIPDLFLEYGKIQISMEIFAITIQLYYQNVRSNRDRSSVSMVSIIKNELNKV